MDYVLKTHLLTKKYRKSTVLDCVSVNIPSGAIYGLIGRNGAGKTTLIRLICGLQRPTDGGYMIYGIAGDDKNIVKARRRMGAVIETPAFYPDMSAIDNMRQQAIILGLPSYDTIPDLLHIVGLDGTGKKKAKNFSLGMKQRLGIALALLGDPDFIVLDEPTNGLDPEGIVEIRELILRLNREMHITFLISSHILSELSRFATHYGFIEKGRLIEEISADELERNYRKCLRVEVSDTGALACVLDGLGAEYEIVSERIADIFSEITLSALVFALSKENCELISSQPRDEDLEAYFINLIGGERNG